MPITGSDPGAGVFACRAWSPLEITPVPLLWTDYDDVEKNGKGRTPFVGTVVIVIRLSMMSRVIPMQGVRVDAHLFVGYLDLSGTYPLGAAKVRTEIKHRTCVPHTESDYTRYWGCA